MRCVHSEKIKSLTKIGRLVQDNKVKTEEQFMVLGAGQMFGEERHLQTIIEAERLEKQFKIKMSDARKNRDDIA